jgi:hypothetical protein
MTHKYRRSTCVGEMLTPKSRLSSRALLCSGTPPPTNKLVNLNNLNKNFSNTIKSATLHGAFVQPLTVITDGHVKGITKLIIGWTVHC